MLSAALVLVLSASISPNARVSARPPRAPKADGAVLAPAKLPDGPGQITYVTADNVYVDRGSADGVAAGNALAVTRAGKAVGTCTVAAVTEYGATCTGAGFQPGDRVNVVRKAKPLAAPLAPVPDAKEIASRLRKVEQTAPPLVDFEGEQNAAGPAATTALGISVAISHTTFSNFVGHSGPYQLQRVDAQLRDFRIWRGLRASADVSVLNWSQRPQEFGNPYRAQTQVFVRRLEVDWREAGGHFDLAVGRIWLRHVPGLAMVDGAQAAVHTVSDSVEGGVFGGLLPYPLTLSPVTPNGAQWTAGAYANAKLSRGDGADAVFFEPEARLNFAVHDGQSGRLEAGIAMHTWLGRIFDGHALVQLGMLNATAPGFVDFGRVDLGLHPAEAVQVSLGARYRGNPNGDVLELGAPTPGARGLNADAVALVALKSVTLGLNGMYAMDLDSALTQASVGAQVQFPRLFGRAGGVAVGFNEEAGWLPGRSAWVQLTLMPVWRFRFLARVSWFMEDGSATAAAIAGHELGASLGVDLRLTTWLWLRLSALGRQSLNPVAQSETDNAPGGLPWRTGISGSGAVGIDL
jgi:hypothetical protein